MRSFCLCRVTRTVRAAPQDQPSAQLQDGRPLVFPLLRVLARGAAWFSRPAPRFSLGLANALLPLPLLTFARAPQVGELHAEKELERVAAPNPRSHKAGTR